MAIELYTPVRVLVDDYADEGVHAGDVGYVIEAYPDAYEVEFSRPDGTTIAQLAIREADLKPAPEVERRRS